MAIDPGIKFLTPINIETRIKNIVVFAKLELNMWITKIQIS